MVCNVLFCLHSLQVGETGKVVGIDHIPELVADSERNVRSDDPDLLTSGRVILVGSSHVLARPTGSATLFQSFL